MSSDSPQEIRLAAAINYLMRFFLLEENDFPPAQGRTKFNPLDFNIIRFIAAHPGCIATDIVRDLRVGPTTLQSALDRLVRKGVLLRTVHRGDARARALELSGEGESLFEAITEQDNTNMRAVLATLDADERRTFLELADKVVEGLGG